MTPFVKQSAICRQVEPFGFRTFIVMITSRIYFTVVMTAGVSLKMAFRIHISKTLICHANQRPAKTVDRMNNKKKKNKKKKQKKKKQEASSKRKIRNEDIKFRNCPAQSKYSHFAGRSRNSYFAQDDSELLLRKVGIGTKWEYLSLCIYL